MRSFFRDKEEYRILHKLFRKSEIAYTISDISKALGPMIDLMFISSFFGKAGITVIGYISPLIVFLEMLGTCIGSGARNKVSNFVGAGDLDGATRGFSASVFMGQSISVFLLVLVIIFGSGITHLLGARDPAIFEMTKQYLFGYIIGYPFYVLSRILTPYLQMEGQYSRVTAASILTTVIDIAGDILVIYIFHGGMFEIGLATSFGYFIPFLINASYFLRKKNHSAFHFSRKGIKPDLCLEIMKLGSPFGIVKASNAVGGMVINNLMTVLNVPNLVAVYGVFSQLTSFLRSSWYAPADTLQAFTGMYIGEEDRDSIREMQRIAVLHGLMLTGIATALLFIFAKPLSGAFMKSDDPAALEMCVECIRVACFALPFHAIVYTFNNYLMAVKKVHFSSLYGFLVECGNLVPITFLLLQILDYHGAWAAKLINMSFLSLIAVIYILRFHANGSFRDKMLLLPSSFGIAPENFIAIEATSTDEILDLSRIAVAFALEHGACNKRANIFGLITEELSAFFATHSFSDGKPHNVSAKLIAKDEDLIIRMRDDCKMFNITEYYKMIQADRKIEDGISLSIIMKMAKDVRYTDTFGANNLIIRI